MNAARIYGKRDDGTWIEDAGRVVRLLGDDDDPGGCHQRFVLDTGGGRTLLVAHNNDVADRVPLGIGDRVRFRGVYEWNEHGGAVHWTHRDPHGAGEGGFIRFRRRTYR